MIAVMAAMEEEFKGLKEAMTVTRSQQDKECRFHEGTYQGRNLLLAHTGIGRRRASDGALAMFERFQPGAIISTGFAGALDSSLKTGDMFIYSSLRGIAGEMPQSEAKLFPLLSCHPELASLAGKTLVEKAIAYSRGTGISATRAAADPETKAWLGQASGARAVDMESYWIAQIAAERGIPFIAVRAISDAIDTNLSPLLAFVNLDGSWDKRRAIAYFLGHPWQVPRTLVYSGKVRRARRHLEAFLKAFVARLNETGLGGR